MSEAYVNVGNIQYSHSRISYNKSMFFMAGEGFVWLYMYEDGMEVPKEFEIIDFKGGLYAAATDIDQKTDKELMDTEIDKFLSENRFERDTSRSELGTIITSQLAKKIMGYDQMGYDIPIKPK